MVGNEYKIPINRGEKTKVSYKALGAIVGLVVVLAGAAMVVKSAADWGAKHQWIWQSVIKQKLELQLPWRIEDVEPEIIIPVIEQVAYEDFTPTEQKIVDIWGFRDGIMAMAVFDCGESGLDQYAVSSTGDLGVAQINWATWKNEVAKEFGYNAADMFDVDKNLEVAYWIWDRNGDGEGNWNPWTGFTNGKYLNCLR